MDRKRVLIVEDELISAEYLKEIVTAQGYDVVEIVSGGAEAVEAARRQRPDLIFMDMMLNDNVSGAEAALQIKSFCDAKILFLTAYADSEMVDYAVAASAWGYLMKPYNDEQIIANLRLALSTAAAPPSGSRVLSGSEEVVLLKHGYEYHPAMRRLLLEGQEVELGPRALSLIALLCKHVDISISNEQIAMHIYQEPVNDRTLRSLVHRIRKTLGEDVIRNVNGVGYMIVSEE